MRSRSGRGKRSAKRWSMAGGWGDPRPPKAPLYLAEDTSSGRKTRGVEILRMRPVCLAAAGLIVVLLRINDNSFYPRYDRQPALLAGNRLRRLSPAAIQQR